ncbi:MAG: hypothetical protein HY049_15005 [Acidobacteria bacterium]|nr:hypothetical protein [Acidobacteriota bacterium]
MTTAGRERLDERTREARLYFQRHHANAVPDAGFVARVTARLTPDPAGTLGWAAMRLLPASLLLALVLGYVSVRTTGSGDAPTVRAGDDDVIAWVLEGREAGR